MKATRDSNGRPVGRMVKFENGRWGAYVWFGGANNFATNKRRYYYSTRAQAHKADISDEIGKNGRIA